MRSAQTVATITENDLTRRWSLAPDDAAEALRARGAEHRLRCAVQLCTLRATGRFVADWGLTQHRCYQLQSKRDA